MDSEDSNTEEIAIGVVCVVLFICLMVFLYLKCQKTSPKEQLFQAAEKGDLKTFSKCVDTLQEVNPTFDQGYGITTPLHKAVYYGQLAICEIILNQVYQVILNLCLKRNNF